MCTDCPICNGHFPCKSFNCGTGCENMRRSGQAGSKDRTQVKIIKSSTCWKCLTQWNPLPKLPAPIGDQDSLVQTPVERAQFEHRWKMLHCRLCEQSFFSAYLMKHTLETCKTFILTKEKVRSGRSNIVIVTEDLAENHAAHSMRKLNYWQAIFCLPEAEIWIVHYMLRQIYFKLHDERWFSDVDSPVQADQDEWNTRFSILSRKCASAINSLQKYVDPELENEEYVKKFTYLFNQLVTGEEITTLWAAALGEGLLRLAYEENEALGGAIFDRERLASCIGKHQDKLKFSSRIALVQQLAKKNKEQKQQLRKFEKVCSSLFSLGRAFWDIHRGFCSSACKEIYELKHGAVKPVCQSTLKSLNQSKNA